METTYPTTRTVFDICIRIDYLLMAQNSSAQSCITDARNCLSKHLIGAPFPSDSGVTPSALPTSWLDSASAWIDRAMMHEHGVFNVPTWW